MDQHLKSNLILVGYGITLFVALFHITEILNFFQQGINIIRPILAGAILAFVLNVPMVKVHNFLLRFCYTKSKKPKEIHLQTISLIITLSMVCGIFAALGILVIPPLINSVVNVVTLLEKTMPVWEEQLATWGINGEGIRSIFKMIQGSIQKAPIGQGFNVIFNVAFSKLSSTIGSVFSAVIALIIAIYFLMGKKEIYRGVKELAYAIFPQDIVTFIGKIWRLLCKTYFDFFSGQCVEAVILGLLIFFSFFLAKLPYAGLIAVMTAVSSFIPYVGSFLSCGIGALLVFMINPWQALLAIIVYQVVQFCENQFIYPRVVGGAVGLPAMWTLLAVLIGGKIGGIVGMVFCIPLTSVFFVLMNEFVKRKLEEKNIVL